MRPLSFGAVAVTMLAVIGQVEVGHGHAKYPTVRAIAATSDGGYLHATTFGTLRQAKGSRALTWTCEKTFGPDHPSRDPNLLVLDGNDLFLVSNGVGYVSSTEGCDWTPIGGDFASRWLYAAAPVPGDEKQAWIIADLPPGLVRGDPRQSKAWQESWPKGWHMRHPRGLATGPKTDDVTILLFDDSDESTPKWSLWHRKPDQTPVAHPLPMTEGFFELAPSHPTNAALLLVRERANAGDALLRSVDGGQTVKHVLQLETAQDLRDAIWWPPGEGTELLVGGLVGGLWRSTDSAETFTRVKDHPEIGCLRSVHGQLHACTNNFIDHAAVMKRQSDGTWSATACFGEVTGVDKCDNGSETATLCQQSELDELTEQLGLKTTQCKKSSPGPKPTPKPDEGLCSVTHVGAPSMVWALLFAIALLIAVRARRMDDVITDDSAATVMGKACQTDDA